MNRLFLLASLVFAVGSAFSQTCTRTWKVGDTTYTDPDARIIFKENAEGKLELKYAPSCKATFTIGGGNNGGGTSNRVFSVQGALLTDLLQPIANETVILGGQSVQTNAKGEFAIHNLPANKRHVIYAAPAGREAVYRGIQASSKSDTSHITIRAREWNPPPN